MEYGRLGNSGLKVSKIIYGAMSVGTKKWRDWVIEGDEALELLKYAYDKGLRTFDTANMYSAGFSEEVIGKFLKTYNIDRSTVVILSKCFFPVDFEWDGTQDINDPKWIYKGGLSRRAIFNAVEASVERLGTYIDVLQIHRLDKTVTKEEIMKALHDVVESGKVRYIGASSMRATEFAQMQFIAEKNGWTKFISMQNYHNAVYREEEREMIPFCKETGVGLIPWSPIARGALARPFHKMTDSARGKTDALIGLTGGVDSDREIINRVEELAKKKGVSMAQIAIAWSLAKGNYPIVGLGSKERIDEAVAVFNIKLSDEDISFIDEPYVAHKVLGFS